MRCETRNFGYECREDATHFVSSGLTKHFACEKHAKIWKSIDSPDVPVVVVRLTALETAPVQNLLKQASILQDVHSELMQACGKHVSMNSAHEAYGIILEELDEFWEEVRKKPENRYPPKMKRELVQVAAMACRAIQDLGLSTLGEEV